MITNGNEPDSSSIENIPVGLYYYYLDKSMTYDMNVLGYAPTIESVTFNPFIESDDINLIASNFDVDKFGKPNNTIPKCYRIANNPRIQKDLYETQLFPYRIEYENDYEPKLFCYPFRYFLITDYINPPLLIKPQLAQIGNNNIKVSVVTSPLSQSGKYNLYVANYKNDLIGNLEGSINNTSLMLPVSSSVYSNFLATSSNSFNKNIENALLENDMSLRHGIQQNSFNKWSGMASNGLGAVTDLMIGNVGGLVARGLSGVSSFMGAEMTEKQMREQSGLKENMLSGMASSQITDMLSTPKSLKTCGNDTLFNLTNSRQKIDIIEFRPSFAYYQRIKAYFERYGYSINRYERINIRTRKHFNFIKTHICNIYSPTVPHVHIAEIKNVLNNGVTFWHVENGTDIGNYSVVNREVKF